MRVALVLALLLWTRTSRASSCDELVREGRAHEGASEDEIAVRRYTDAITLDGTCEGAFAALATLRLRQADGREAERVAQVALTRLPLARGFLVLLARAKWTQGRREEAERDLDAYALEAGATEAEAAMKELSGWYGAEGKAPAQLAIWRRYFTLAERRADERAQREARAMIKALTILVGDADPVARADTPVRRAIRAHARDQVSQKTR